MPVNFKSPHFSDNLHQLDNILKRKADELIIPPDALNRKGVARGPFVGGNLSILYNLQSTPYEMQTDKVILFIEDVGEQLYHLDRMMQNLLLSGKLSKLRGLIVGNLTDMQDKQIPFGKTANEIIFEAVKNFDFPVAFNFPAGHIPYNVPFILGARIKLEVNASGTRISQSA